MRCLPDVTDRVMGYVTAKATKKGKPQRKQQRKERIQLTWRNSHDGKSGAFLRGGERGGSLLLDALTTKLALLGLVKYDIDNYFHVAQTIFPVPCSAIRQRALANATRRPLAVLGLISISEIRQRHVPECEVFAGSRGRLR